MMNSGVIHFLTKVGITALVTFLVPIFTLSLVASFSQDTTTAQEGTSCSAEHISLEIEGDTGATGDDGVFYTRVRDQVMEIWRIGSGQVCVSVVKELPDELKGLELTEESKARYVSLIASEIRTALARSE